MTARARSLLLSGLALLAAGCGRETVKNKKRERPPVPVTVRVVSRSTLKRELILAGTVRPRSRVNLCSKLAGRIEEMTVEICDRVEKGQVVARLDRRTLEAQVNQARAAVGVAGADVKRASVALADAGREHKRVESLFKEGAANEQSRDKARTAREAAAAVLELARNQRTRAQAALAAARAGLDETVIRATIGGTVSRRHLDQGDFAGPGQPLLTVLDLSSVKVTGAVTQGDLPLLQPGRTRVRIQVQGVARPFDATVTRIEPSVDPATLTARVEIDLANRRHPAAAGARAGASPWVLSAGMHARVKLELESRDNVPVLPRDAVRNDGRKDFVFVVPAVGERVQRADVKLGLHSGTLVEIVEPKDLVGKRVVVKGATRISDGSMIEVVAPPAGGSGKTGK